MLTPRKSKKKIIFGVVAIAILGVGAFVLAQLALNGRFNQTSKASLGSSVDVVIAGAGSSGVSAAIQAAREGSTVLLVEETDWVGGQMTTAAVSTMDTGNYIQDKGIYGEFINRVIAYYQQRGKSIGTCYISAGTQCFEPKVGQLILKQMIAEQPGITLKLRTKVIGITKSNGAVTGAVINGNLSPSSSQTLIPTKVLIDATEYGDILPLAGVPYRAANEISGNLSTNSSLPACIQDITYTAVARKYPVGTMPSSLKITTPPPGYSAAIEADFAQFVTKNGNSTWGSYPYNWAFHNAYRGLPDSNNPANYTGTDYTSITKTVINFANDFATNVKYLEDATYRKSVSCAAKLKTIQFLYYVQTKLGESNWSVANDEGYDTAYNAEENDCPNIPSELKAIEHNMPQMAYVRESRRAIGALTLTAKDIKRSTDYTGAKTRFTDSIAIADYPSDLHGCNSEGDLETSLEHRSDLPVNTTGGVENHWISGPFQIPMSTLTTPSLKGLILAEKNISQTRLVNGATRLQPSTMLIGQAAGALAGLAVRKNATPERVPALEVQRELLAKKDILFPYWDANTADKNFTSVQLLSLRGIVAGYMNGTFGSNNGLKRDEAAVILTRSFDLPAAAAVQIFSDVPSTYWAFPFVNSLSASGITGGCTTTTPPRYCPQESLSNAQIAVFALRGWQRTNGSIAPFAAPTQTYTDLPPSHWAYGFAEELALNGIKWYCNEAARTFCPDSPATRGTMASVIDAVLWKTNVTTAVDDTVIVTEPTSDQVQVSTGQDNTAVEVPSSSSDTDVPATPLVTATSTPVITTSIPTTIIATTIPTATVPVSPIITATPTGIPLITHTPTPAPTTNSPGQTSTAFNKVYFTFARFRYGKYVAPSQLRVGDTLYFKNYDTSKLKLLQVFLYDYEKKGNQEFIKSNVTTQSMYVRTKYIIPAGKRYAYVAKFLDKATGYIGTKYFVIFTTPEWNGKSVL